MCHDSKLPVVSLARAMCPPLSQKGELYFEGPVPLPTVGGGEFSKENQQLFSEADAELEWSADVHRIEPESIFGTRRCIDAIESFISPLAIVVMV